MNAIGTNTVQDTKQSSDFTIRQFAKGDSSEEGLQFASLMTSSFKEPEFFSDIREQETSLTNDFSSRFDVEASLAILARSSSSRDTTTTAQNPSNGFAFSKRIEVVNPLTAQSNSVDYESKSNAGDQQTRQADTNSQEPVDQQKKAHDGAKQQDNNKQNESRVMDNKRSEPQINSNQHQNADLIEDLGAPKSYLSIASERFASMRVEQRRILETLQPGALTASQGVAEADSSITTNISALISDNQKQTRLESFASIRSPLNTKGFAEEASSKISLFIDKRVSSATISLSPDTMGAVKINIEVKGNDVFMRLAAKDDATAQLFMQNLGTLKESLAEKGLTLHVGQESSFLSGGFDQNATGRDNQNAPENAGALQEADAHNFVKTESQNPGDGYISKA